MKLTIEKIREESFEVKPSVKNIKKMHDYQIGLAKSTEELEKAQSGTMQEIITATLHDDMNFFKKAEVFISEILKLNKEEMEKLEELERTEFMTLQSKIVLILQGYSDLDVEEMFKEEVDSAEKKEQALKND
ncbi:phage tail tube assembly chaperone [Lactococcus garvieae]|uniref:phage tail tube assembly chaperone n=1 Tax=Lactococcus garvieae TaxID=1363 RepID=UPI0038546BF6